MCTFKDFLRWYNNKDVIPTLEAMQKMVDNLYRKEIEVLKLRCTSPNLPNICLHKSTTAKFYPITENDKELLERIRGDMVGGPSLVFTGKTVVKETFVRDSTYWCLTTVGTDFNQLYPYSMSQAMPTDLYTRRELDSESSNFKPR